MANLSYSSCIGVLYITLVLLNLTLFVNGARERRPRHKIRHLINQLETPHEFKKGVGLLPKVLNLISKRIADRIYERRLKKQRGFFEDFGDPWKPEDFEVVPVETVDIPDDVPVFHFSHGDNLEDSNSRGYDLISHGDDLIPHQDLDLTHQDDFGGFMEDPAFKPSGYQESEIEFDPVGGGWFIDTPFEFPGVELQHVNDDDQGEPIAVKGWGDFKLPHDQDELQKI